MNPGLLDTRLIHERRAAGREADGSISRQWNEIGPTWTRRMRPRGGTAAKDERPGDAKDEERRLIVFRVRSQPFLSRYVNGDRFREDTANNLPPAVWRVIAWTEAEGMRGEYVDVSCEAWAD